MSIARIASRYAKSLLDLAQEGNKLEKVKQDVELFSSVLDNREFYMMIQSRIIKSDKKLAIFKGLFDGKIDELTAAFFDIVIRKGREEFFPGIAESFQDQYNEMHNITTAHVTTAQAISDDLLDSIKSKLPALGVRGGTVEIEKSVDPSLIGGFILQVGDKLIDASVKTKLANLKKQLVDA